MIEIGTVEKHDHNTGTITVHFAHLSTSAECSVLQATTGANAMFVLPSVGTQVVCWIESGKNIALGSIFSTDDKVPTNASAEGLYAQIGKMIFNVSDDKMAIENQSTSLRKLFEALLKIVSELTVSTANGPSGTPLPPTVQAIEQAKQTISTLFK